MLLEIGESLVCLGKFKVDRPGLYQPGWRLAKRLTPRGREEPECGEQGRRFAEASALALPRRLPLHRPGLGPPRATPRPLRSIPALLPPEISSTQGVALEARAGWQSGWVQSWLCSLRLSPSPLWASVSSWVG